VGLEEEISPKPATDGGKSFDSSRYNNLLRFYLQSRAIIALVRIISFLRLPVRRQTGPRAQFAARTENRGASIALPTIDLALPGSCPLTREEGLGNCRGIPFQCALLSEGLAAEIAILISFKDDFPS
jgi:hypothetical protein